MHRKKSPTNKDKGVPPLNFLNENGLMENITSENHIFINKLNYICKNYEAHFKDVSITSNRHLCLKLVTHSPSNIA